MLTFFTVSSASAKEDDAIPIRRAYFSSKEYLKEHEIAEALSLMGVELQESGLLGESALFGESLGFDELYGDRGPLSGEECGFLRTLITTNDCSLVRRSLEESGFGCPLMVSVIDSLSCEDLDAIVFTNSSKASSEDVASAEFGPEHCDPMRGLMVASNCNFVEDVLAESGLSCATFRVAMKAMSCEELVVLINEDSEDGEAFPGAAPQPQEFMPLDLEADILGNSQPVWQDALDWLAQEAPQSWNGIAESQGWGRADGPAWGRADGELCEYDQQCKSGSWCMQPLGGSPAGYHGYCEQRWRRRQGMRKSFRN